MRRISYVLVVLVLLNSVYPPDHDGFAPLDTAAQNVTTTATVTEPLNLRTGPALTYDTITVMPVGSQVTLTGQDVNGYRSVVHNGQPGWAFATYLSIDSPPPSPSETATAIDRLNLRSGPGTSFDVLTVIPAGAVVTLNGESANGFRSVTYNGFSGWVSAQYLDFDATPPSPAPDPDNTATTTDAVNLRSGPGTSFSVITVMPRGSEVVLTGQASNGFLAVSYNGQNGWASDDYLAIPGTVPAPSETAVTTARVNLRSGPDTSSTVLTVLPEGIQVTLTGQVNNGFHSVFWNGFSGWAFSAYLSFGEAPSPIPEPVVFYSTDAIVGSTRGSVAEAMNFARANGADRIDDVERFVTEMYRLAPTVGFDPAILVAQSAHETGNWTSFWWNERLNPAGLGVTGDPAQNAASPTFPSGTIAARAQIAHMHAEVYGSSRPLPAILQGVDPTYQRVFEAGWAGTIRTIEDLTGTWAVDPEYDVKLVRKANLIFGDDLSTLIDALLAVLQRILLDIL